MAGVSRITLIGNLGRDPETSYTPSGLLRVQFSMAVSRRFNDQSGQLQERTNWFRVTGLGRLAETMDKLSQQGALVKGKQVYVDGRFEAREYQDQQGQTRTSLDVIANDLQLLGSRADAGGFGAEGGSGEAAGGGTRARPVGQGGSRSGDEYEPDTLDDVPF